MIFLDECRREGKSGLYCRMLTNGDLEELHRFARTIGLYEGWFHPQDEKTLLSVPYYRLRLDKRKKAIEHGAVEAGPGIILDVVRKWNKERK